MPFANAPGSPQLMTSEEKKKKEYIFFNKRVMKH